MESNDTDGMANDLAPAHATEIRSPLAGKAWLVEARALQATDAAESVRVLREHYAELPQPEGDVTLADCYQAAERPAPGRRVLPARLLSVPHGRCRQARRGRPADPERHHGRSLSAAAARADAAPRRSPAGAPRITRGRGRSTSRSSIRWWAWRATRRGCASAPPIIWPARRRPRAPICAGWSCPNPRPTPSASITWWSAPAT